MWSLCLSLWHERLYIGRLSLPNVILPSTAGLHEQVYAGVEEVLMQSSGMNASFIHPLRLMCNTLVAPD